MGLEPHPQIFATSVALILDYKCLNREKIKQRLKPRLTVIFALVKIESIFKITVVFLL